MLRIELFECHDNKYNRALIKISGTNEKIFIHNSNRRFGLTVTAVGPHLVSFRTQKLSPPAFCAVLWYESPREPQNAVSHFLKRADFYF